MLDPADIELVRTMPIPHDAPDLSGLTTIAEVIGYTVALARHEGDDEVACIELVLRSAETSPDDVRAAERILRPLGYVQVADMMRRLAGRRKHGLAPLGITARKL